MFLDFFFLLEREFFYCELFFCHLRLNTVDRFISRENELMFSCFDLYEFREFVELNKQRGVPAVAFVCVKSGKVVT